MDGPDGDTCSAGLALEGPISVAQPPNPICYPPSPSQPMPCSVLAPPKHRPGPPFPGTYLLFPLPCQPLSLPLPVACLPACCFLCPVPSSCLQPQQNSQSPSELTTSFPTSRSRTLLRTQFSGRPLHTLPRPSLDTHTYTHSTHRRPRRPFPPPDKAKSRVDNSSVPDATTPLDLLACPRQSTASQPHPGPLITA